MRIQLQQTLEQKDAEIAELKAAAERTAATNSWLEAETSRLREVVQRKQEQTAELKEAVGELTTANDEQAARIAELERGAAGLVFQATVIREERVLFDLSPAAAEKRAKKLAQWRRLKASFRGQAVPFVYFDYKHVQMTAPIEWWRESTRPAVLLLRVEDTREWLERPSVDLADCVHVARRLPTGAWWSGGAFQSADLVLYAKPRPESAALAAALVRDFQAAANLTDFLQAVALSPPTDDSRALLLAPYREYLRFHAFAARNPRSVSNYPL
ncbi:hypothetical protein M3Y99_00574600 [Aphelenchoides fujianensis]|nr:hypothetical protein M3Y99_00574600 [Aphelenchoides fujianensis]